MQQIEITKFLFFLGKDKVETSFQQIINEKFLDFESIKYL